MIELDDYQEKSKRTLMTPEEMHRNLSPQEFALLWTSTGISGESGELLDLIKKGIFHEHGIDEDKLFYELGDIMFYIAGLCTVMGWKLSDVAESNVAKLLKRYPDGFNSEDSVNRAL